MKKEIICQRAGDKELASKIFTALILMLVIFILAMLSQLDIFTKAGYPGRDSSVFQYIGWAMTEGKVPYRDLFDHKGPLLFFLNYIGTFIERIRGIWVIEVAFIFATVVLIYKTARRTLRRGYSLLVTLLSLAPMSSYFNGGNFTEEYALLFQVTAIYIFLDFFAAPEKYDTIFARGSFLHWGNKWFNMGVFLCGLCFAGVFLLRANMISCWIVFCVAVLIYCVREKKYLALRKFILSFILGACVFILPTMFYLIKNHAFVDFIYDYFIFNMQYSSDAERANPVSRINALVTFLNTLPTILSLTVVAVKAKLEWRKSESLACLFDCSYFVYILFTLVLIAMSGQTYLHYGMTLCPTYIYPFCVMCKALSEKDSKQAKVDIVVIVYLLITFLVPSWATITQNAVEDIYNGTHMENNGWYDNEIVSYILEHTTYNDEITVFGNENVYYLYSERMSASKYSYQFPIGTISPDILNEYFEELENHQPEIVVWINQKESVQMSNFLEENDYLCVIDGDILVYQKK